MFDEIGYKPSEKEIIKAALMHIADANELLFELESYSGKTLAFMTESIFKYCECVYSDWDPRDDDGLEFTVFGKKSLKEYQEDKNLTGVDLTED